jgi:hypothetical protein
VPFDSPSLQCTPTQPTGFREKRTHLVVSTAWRVVVAAITYEDKVYQGSPPLGIWFKTRGSAAAAVDEEIRMRCVFSRLLDNAPS